MWAAVSFFNPSMALLALALVPIASVAENQEALLSHMGLIAGGKWLSIMVSVDAALVLSGAVLTSYIGVTARLEHDLKFLGEAYPDINIEYVEVEGTFGPELIEKLSTQWKIPTNFMFIGSPGDHFPYRLEELGGVRLII
jgi:hypothetical protein